MKPIEFSEVKLVSIKMKLIAVGAALLNLFVKQIKIRCWLE